MSIIEILTKAKELGIRLWVEEGGLKYKAPGGVLTEE